MKYKEFLTKLKKDGKITAAEFDAAIESAPDADFPDAAVPHFENAFLTLDRAATHKDIHGRIKREALDPIDNDFAELVEFHLKDYIDPLKFADFKKEVSTYNKSASLKAILPDVIKKIKAAPAGGDEELKKKLKTYEETNADLLARIEKANSEVIEKEKFYKKDFEKKISDYKLNNELEKLANSFKLAKEFSNDNVRKLITKGKLDEIRKSHSLEYVETQDGQASIVVLDKDGKPRFNGNTQVTINNLLEEAFKDVIKVNNTDDDDSVDTSQRQVTKQFQVPDNNSGQRRQAPRTTVSL